MVSRKIIVLPVAGIILFAFSITSLAQEKVVLETKSEQEASADRWLAWDKAKHVLASAFLVGFGFNLYKYDLDNSHKSAISFGVGISLSAGLLKEYADSQKKGGKASYKDLVADVLGIGLGLLVFVRAQ